MVVLRYEGAPGADWTALVGKGLMFDAGGYHLKSVDGMNGMKYDMCGAAEMMEILEYLAIQKVEKNVMAVLMLAENVISPDGRCDHNAGRKDRGSLQHRCGRTAGIM